MAKKDKTETKPAEAPAPVEEAPAVAAEAAVAPKVGPDGLPEGHAIPQHVLGQRTS